MFNYLHTCNPIGQMHAITSALLNKYQKMQKLLHASAHYKYVYSFICNNLNAKRGFLGKSFSPLDVSTYV